MNECIMRLVTWNINGIRSLRTSLTEHITENDVICLQETKTTRDQTSEEIAIVENFTSYYSFCRTKSGYSGVATYCHNKCKPVAAEEGLSGILYTKSKSSTQPQDLVGMHIDYSNHFTPEQLVQLDREGRAVITKHKICDAACGASYEHVAIINVYCPRADEDNEDRFEYKMNFYKLLELRAESLVRNKCHVVIVGDFNVSHKPIDHCDPGHVKEFSSRASRRWMSQFLDSAHHPHFIDTFRHFHPDRAEAFTCWRTDTGARRTNYGTRIDYIIADRSLVSKSFRGCEIQGHIEGSDHAPVSAEVDVTPVASDRAPGICSTYWPEFVGRQQKLTSFLVKGGSAGNKRGIEDMWEGGERGKVPQRQRAANKQTVLSSFFTKADSAGSKKVVSAMCSSNITGGGVTSEHSCFVSDTSVGDNIISSSSVEQVSTWRHILSGPPTAPLCRGHREPCLLRVVKKTGVNYGRSFYVCGRPEGRRGNPLASCQHFQWLSTANSRIKSAPLPSNTGK